MNRCARPALVSSLVLAASNLGAQELRSLDDAAVERLAEQLAPVVERVCGKRFAKPPLVVLADAGDLMRVMRVELQAGGPRRIGGALRDAGSDAGAGVAPDWVGPAASCFGSAGELP